MCGNSFRMRNIGVGVDDARIVPETPPSLRVMLEKLEQEGIVAIQVHSRAEVVGLVPIGALFYANYGDGYLTIVDTSSFYADVMRITDNDRYYVSISPAKDFAFYYVPKRDGLDYTYI